MCGCGVYVGWVSGWTGGCSGVRVWVGCWVGEWMVRRVFRCAGAGRVLGGCGDGQAGVQVCGCGAGVGWVWGWTGGWLGVRVWGYDVTVCAIAALQCCMHTS